MDDDAPDEAVAEAETDEATDGAAPKKKQTRRGTRGGRGRKKKPAGAAAASSESDDAAGNGAKATPTIHIPPPDLGVAGEEADDADDAPAEPGAQPEPAAERALRQTDSRRRSARGAGRAADGGARSP